MKTKYTDEFTDMCRRHIASLTSVIEYFELKGFETDRLVYNRKKMQKVLNIYVKSKLTKVSSPSMKNSNN